MSNWHKRGASDAKRVRGRRWMAKRAEVLTREPWCRKCKAKGLLVLAVIVDHIVQIAKGGAAMDDDNLQPLCGPCHDAKSASEGVAVAKPRVATGVDGWPVG